MKKHRDCARNDKTDYPDLQPVLVARSPRSLEPSISCTQKQHGTIPTADCSGHARTTSRLPHAHLVYQTHTLSHKWIKKQQHEHTLPVPRRLTPPSLQAASSFFPPPRLLPLRTASARCPVDDGPMLRSPVESQSQTCSWVCLVCSREEGAER